MVLGPFAETKGPRLPGRNPASLEQENNSPAMSLSNKKVFSPEHHGFFLKMPKITISKKHSPLSMLSGNC